ncbi:oxygen-independent coproporphyrinogen-3 oxidase [Spirosomataceae bacterium TFI 002]|nr:oxygen-independent coproporphyrinogen-3 oxidase [Spirosomataceae bacterium TFI 002]
MDLFTKYNIPGPRYTSYPTVPFWQTDSFNSNAWKECISTNNNLEKPISVYIHLPFCESLCTFCACHKRITKNHSLETPYIDAVIAEWSHYFDLFGKKPTIAELHLGGGTPSFFSPESLDKLLKGIFQYANKAEAIDFSWEGHPNNTSFEHLKVLNNHGFERVSFGVQDYDPVVQKAIHRIQPFENVERVTRQAREIGYTSVSHDLVFGLPFQTKTSIENTINKTLELKPDRISFYSYAHVPWIKGNGQRGFNDDDLPSGPEKRELYDFGRQMLEANGYFEVGMDHFAKTSDPLFTAMKNGSLHRNFMGYTVQNTSMLIGLGASAISDIGNAYAQNSKDIKAYENSVANGELPLLKGHIMSPNDVFLKAQILNIMCRFGTTWKVSDWDTKDLFLLIQKLKEFEEDGLVEIHSKGLKVTPLGIPFVRNIAMLFDAYLLQKKGTENLFSQTV